MEYLIDPKTARATMESRRTSDRSQHVRPAASLRLSQLFSLFLTLVCSVVFSFQASAQVDLDAFKSGDRVVVSMENGKSFTGYLVSLNETSVVLTTDNGEMTLKTAKIKSMRKSVYEGAFDFKNTNDTRYFFGPSAIPIGEGEGYYQNVMVTFNFVNVGVTKNFSVGGGFEWISLMLGNPILFFTPKVGFDINDKLHAGGGLLIGGITGEGSATLAYGVFTVGNSDSHATAGIGYGLLNGDWSDNPAIMVSGTHRVTSRFALLTENYFFGNGDGNSVYVGTHGVRFLGEKNSFDIGGVVSPEWSEDIFALPYVTYVRAF